MFDREALEESMKLDKMMKDFTAHEEFEYDGGKALVMSISMKMPMCKERDMVTLMYSRELEPGKKSLGFNRSINYDAKPKSPAKIRM